MRQNIGTLVVTVSLLVAADCKAQDSPQPNRESTVQASETPASDEAEPTWIPPAAPDPSMVLDEAQADARAGRHAEALAKHVWFHQHALEHDPALYGVRLSFALMYWNELSKVYPPAKEKLVEIRDETKAAVLTEENPFQQLHDLQSINEVLGEPKSTVESFKSLAEANPSIAKKVFRVVKPALVRTKDYDLCGRFLEPKSDFAQMKREYEMQVELADDPRFGEHLVEHAQKTFTNEVATLVALLVKNDRTSEAANVAKDARGVFDNSELTQSLDSALEGQVPPPWP